jgi:hypothetical protein
VLYRILFCIQIVLCYTVSCFDNTTQHGYKTSYGTTQHKMDTKQDTVQHNTIWIQNKIRYNTTQSGYTPRYGTPQYNLDCVVLYRILFCIHFVLCCTVTCFVSRLYCGVPYLGLYPDCVIWIQNKIRFNTIWIQNKIRYNTTQSGYKTRYGITQHNLDCIVVYRILVCIQIVLCYTVSCFVSRLCCVIPYLVLYPYCVVLYRILVC